MRWFLLSTAMLLTLTAVVGTVGCESPEAEQQRLHDTEAARPGVAVGADTRDGAGNRGNGADTGDSRFAAEVTFCRKIGKKSGKRIGIGDRFQVAEKSYVHGLVDFHDVSPHRVYAVHLVWIKPDGRELYRRYAEVVTAPEGDGFTTVINWKKAEDLHDVRQDLQTSPDAAFTLSSRFNVSASRERDLGDYLMRVYLDRRLLLEKRFTLSAG